MDKVQLETLLKENPAAIAAVQKMTAVKLQGKGSRKIQAVTALKDKDHPSHQKAVGIFQKLKDKFSKKKEGEPKKQSQADVDFYKKQYARRTGKELGENSEDYRISSKHQLKVTPTGGIILFGRRGKIMMDRDEIKKLLRGLKKKGFKESRNASITGKELGETKNRRNKMKITEETLRKAIRAEIKSIVTEDDDAFNAPIPAQIERYMKKFIAAVQGARLNRRRTGAILGRVVAAMNIDPSDLQRYVRLVKKGL